MVLDNMELEHMVLDNMLLERMVLGMDRSMDFCRSSSLLKRLQLQPLR